MQSRLHSIIESAANIVIGYVVGVISQLLVFPLFGIQVSLEENLIMGLYFMVVSMARSYALRRAFNAFYIKQLSK